MAVKQATLSLVLKRHATAGVSLSPRDWMRLPPFNRETGCQCRHFLCVSPRRMLPCHGAAGPEGVRSSCPGACPISAAWWRRGAEADGGGGIVSRSSEVALGMAHRLSAWLPWHKLLPQQRACAITVLAGGPATPIQPQRMYKRIRARAAGKPRTGSTSQKTNALFQNIS